MENQSLLTRENILYAIGMLLSGLLLIPCFVMSFASRFKVDYHLQFVKWWQSAVVDESIVFSDIVIRYYYDIPTLFTCKDKQGRRFIFCLLDEDALEYIGVDVSKYDMSLFLDGEIDLRKLFVRKQLLYKHGFYLGKWKGKEFLASVYRNKITEEHLPAQGLKINPAIIETKINQEFHPNGKLAYSENIAILSPKHAHLFPNRRMHPDGYEWIRAGAQVKYFDNGQLAWVIYHDDKGNAIKNEEKNFRKDGAVVIY